MREWGRWSKGLAVGTLLTVVLGIGVAMARAALEIGSPVPDLRLVGTDGKTHSLRDYVGRQWVVVSWYPRASTSG